MHRAVAVAIGLLLGLHLASSVAVPATSHAALELPVRFDSEIVRLVVMADTVEVTGHYWLIRRPGFRRELGLFYPYPVDSLLGDARTLSLEWRPPSQPWRPAPFEEVRDPRGTVGGKGARWRLPATDPAASDTLEVRTVYRQRLRSTYARYIVTTTQVWQRPLTRARFEIELPRGATPRHFSFPFAWHDGQDGDPGGLGGGGGGGDGDGDGDGDDDDGARGSRGDGYYLYETTAFMPERDIIVEWVVPEP